MGGTTEITILPVIKPDRLCRLMTEHAAVLEERRVDEAITVHFGPVDWAALRAGTCLLEASTRDHMDGRGDAAEFDRRLKSLLEVSGSLSA